MQETQEMRVQSLGWGYHLRRAWQPIPVFLLRKSHRQRSLLGYGFRGYKDSDVTEVTEHAHTHTHTHTHMHTHRPALGLASIIIGLCRGSCRSQKERCETDVNLDHILSRIIPGNLRDLANK